MKRAFMNLSMLGLLSLMLNSCSKDDDSNPTPEPDFVVVSGNGDITAKLNEFRLLLGDPLNTTPGQTTGRREINWDGVPDTFIDQALPQRFFNPTEPGSAPAAQRGFLYTGSGEFRVSKNGFGNIEPSLSTQFNSFSGTKVFANISSADWHSDFEVPGQAIPATVRGFGVVFSDVDLPNNSFLEFFEGNKSLGKFFVTPHAAGNSHSFLGVYFKKAKVTRVRISHGNGIIAPGAKDITDGGAADLVALDDFLFDEPTAK